MAEEVVITRVFNAPRDLVWRAWTDAELLKHWWGPKTYTAPEFRIDARVGGEYFGAMQAPDGQRVWSRGIFKEVVEPERLVMTDSFADPEGNTVQASYYGMSGDWPTEMLVTLTLSENDGRTELTLRHSGLHGFSEEDISNMRQGWDESFDKLDELLMGLRGERAAA